MVKVVNFALVAALIVVQNSLAFRPGCEPFPCGPEYCPERQDCTCYHCEPEYEPEPEPEFNAAEFLAMMTLIDELEEAEPPMPPMPYFVPIPYPEYPQQPSNYTDIDEEPTATLEPDIEIHNSTTSEDGRTVQTVDYTERRTPGGNVLTSNVVTTTTSDKK